MAATIQQDDATGILIVTHEGEVTMESRKQVFGEIMGLAKTDQNGVVKVLSDLRRAEIVMNPNEAIKFGELIVDKTNSHSVVIAVVRPIDKPNSFLTESTILLEGDALRLVAFSEYDEAYRWLAEA